jgi:hypothetical protein
VLSKGHTRFNVGLYRTLVMPLFRLVFPLYGLVPTDAQSDFRVTIRRSFRCFMRLPATTPNRILEDMLGDLGPLAEGVGLACDAGEIARREKRPTSKDLLLSLKEQPRIKLLPRSLLPALRLTYGRMCIEHEKPLRVSHLIEHHGV